MKTYRFFSLFSLFILCCSIVSIGCSASVNDLMMTSGDVSEASVIRHEGVTEHGQLLIPKTPEYQAKLSTFPVSPDQAKQNAEIFLAGFNSESNEPINLDPTEEGPCIVGESYLFIGSKDKKGFPFRGYKVNAHTGTVQYVSENGLYLVPWLVK